MDPRGPSEYPGMKAVADREGVQSPGFCFHNDCQKPSSWEAKWIWLSDGPQGPGSTAPVGMFRKEISLAEAPRKVSVAHGRAKCRLYVTAAWSPADRSIWAATTPAAKPTDGSTTPATSPPWFTREQEVIARPEVFREWPVGPDGLARPAGLAFSKPTRACRTGRT